MAHANGDLDYAIALSLQEQETEAKPHSSARFTDSQELALFTDLPLPASKPSADEDFALAVKLQEELNDTNDRGTPADAARAQAPSTRRPAVNACVKCGQATDWRDRRTLSSGEVYHARCLVCDVCGDSLRGEFTVHDGKLSHRECSVALLPACVACGASLQGVFLHHTFFVDHRFCMEHQGAATCFACNRFGGLVRLSDGRSICEICSTDMIIDSEEASLVYPQVLEFMERVLQLRIPPDMRVVPVLAVDLPTLNEQPRGGGHHGHSATTRGLCLSEQTIIRHFGPGGRQQQTQLSQRTVTAILVLHQLPRELFASILAHEAMHAWIKLGDLSGRHLSQQMEEGLCQWVADQFLQHMRDQPQVRQDLIRYFRLCIQTEPSEVYGEGYRKVARAISAIGLEFFLDHAAQSDEFPVV